MDFPRSARSSPTRHNRDHHLDFGDGGAAHFDQSALRRSLELAAKRCCGNLAFFLQNGFRFGYPQIAGRTPSTPTATTCLICGDYSAAACDLVLARAPNWTGILSHHFFGAGGIGIESFWWYWQIAQQNLVSSLTPALSALALVGLFVPQSRDRRCSRVFHWWLARRSS